MPEVTVTRSVRGSHKGREEGLKYSVGLLLGGGRRDTRLCDRDGRFLLSLDVVVSPMYDGGGGGGEAQIFAFACCMERGQG